MENDSDDLPKDDVFGDINDLNRMLDEMDERGLVLSLAAFAEDALGSLLTAFMLPTSTTAQLIEGFNAPLGNFSSRIKAAYSLGLIRKEQFDDLEQLRKIRNLFAHTWQPLGFDDQRVGGHIRSLRFGSLEHRWPETPKDKLRTSIYSVLVALNSMTGRTKTGNGKAKLTGYELITGFTGEFDDQLQEAESTFKEILENVEGSLGEKRAFYFQLLTRLRDRVHYIQGATTEAQRTATQSLKQRIVMKLESL